MREARLQGRRHEELLHGREREDVRDAEGIVNGDGGALGTRNKTSGAWGQEFDRRLRQVRALGHAYGEPSFAKRLGPKFPTRRFA